MRERSISLAWFNSFVTTQLPELPSIQSAQRRTCMPAVVTFQPSSLPAFQPPASRISNLEPRISNLESQYEITRRPSTITTTNNQPTTNNNQRHSHHHVNHYDTTTLQHYDTTTLRHYNTTPVHANTPTRRQHTDTPPTRAVTPSFVRSFVHLFVRFVRSFVRSFASFVRSFVRSLRSLRSFIDCHWE